MTWCLWSCPEPEQSWAFPKRLGLFQQGLITVYYHFQKLIESPTTVRQKEERDLPGPRDNLEGKSCLAGSFLVRGLRRGHIGTPGQPHVRKSCLAGSFLIPWPCHGLGASRQLPTGNDSLGEKKRTTLRKVTSLAHLNPYNSSTTLQFEAQSS